MLAPQGREFLGYLRMLQMKAFHTSGSIGWAGLNSKRKLGGESERTRAIGLLAPMLASTGSQALRLSVLNFI